MACECRKPGPGLLRQAAADLDLDLARAAIVGDLPSDLAAGAAVGARTVLVLTGLGRGEWEYRRELFPVAPDHVCEDLAAAASGCSRRARDRGWAPPHADRRRGHRRRGKTTLVARLAAELRDRGRTVLVVRRYMLDEITALWWRLVDLDAVDQRGTAQLAAADYATACSGSSSPRLTPARRHRRQVRLLTPRLLHPARIAAPASTRCSPACSSPTHVLWLRMDARPRSTASRRPTASRTCWRAGLDHRLGPQHRRGVRALRPRRCAGGAARTPLPRAPRAHRRAVRGAGCRPRARTSSTRSLTAKRWRARR